MLLTLLLSTTLNFTWNAPPTKIFDGDTVAVRGYKLYWGFESGIYINSIDVGNTLSYSTDDIGDEGVILYCAVTAYNNAGESDFSEETFIYLEAKNRPQTVEFGFYDPSEPPLDGIWQDLPGNVLDVTIDGEFVDWGALNGWHKYSISYTGKGQPLRLQIYDTNYADNSGHLEYTVVDGSNLLGSGQINSDGGISSDVHVPLGQQVTVTVTGTYVYWTPGNRMLRADAEFAQGL